MDNRIYHLPRHVFLSPGLQADGATEDELGPWLRDALADRDRMNWFDGDFDHPRYGVLAWSMEVPMDNSLRVSEFYLKCRYVEELFNPFEGATPFWEEPGYKPPEKTNQN